MLGRDEAKRFYDRFGSRQDRQGFYEDRALHELVEHGRFDEAERVVELGCGTGRFARRLLEENLPALATYHGFELSETMAKLARLRLAPFADRALVVRTDGSMQLPLRSACCDRFVSTYVADLLAEREVEALVVEAHRLLRPGGRLALTSLTRGNSFPSRLVAGLWRAVHAVRPALVGGCRPLDLRDALVAAGDGWEIERLVTVVAAAVPSQVVVARRRES